MRFGAPLLEEYHNAQQWIEILKRRNYRAAYSPITGEESDAIINEYANAARDADIVIAEIGAWRCNCVSTVESERSKALEYCSHQLAVADMLGARCCVAIAGSRGEKWDESHADNLREDIFALAVDNIRKIIDTVKPNHTFFTLEPMPCIIPCDVDSYERLIRAVDRPAFAVHYDPVNLAYTPHTYFHNGEAIREFIRRLGRYIRACHVKDVLLEQKYVFHVHEAIPGQGILDYGALFTGLNQLDPDLPIITEHLKLQTEYDQAETFIRQKVQQLGITL